MSISSSNSRQYNRSSSSNYRSTTGNNKSTSSANTVARLPCCPHCTNVNKFMNKNLPTDHWLRETADPTSPIVCKELMATECRVCHNLGHTRSQCPSLAQSGQAQSVIVPMKPLQSKPSSHTTFKSKNVFEDLDNSDDEKPVSKIVNKPVANVSQSKVLPVTKKAKLDLDFPAFGQQIRSSTTTTATATTSDSSILNFAKAIMAPALPTVIKVAPEPVKESVKSAYKPISIAQKNKSWLDSDSGEDDLTEEYIALHRAMEHDFADTQRGRVNSWGNAHDEIY
jgi:hypothetical protein